MTIQPKLIALQTVQRFAGRHRDTAAALDRTRELAQTLGQRRVPVSRDMRRTRKRQMDDAVVLAALLASVSVGIIYVTAQLRSYYRRQV
jgi:hypothetical protein